MFAIPAFAHPTPPPPNGCHICYEYCEELGVPKGDWHCHEVEGIKPTRDSWDSQEGAPRASRI